MGGPKPDSGPPESALDGEEVAAVAETEAARPIFTVLEALSASGLRALRYIKEVCEHLWSSRAHDSSPGSFWGVGFTQIDGVDVVIANDLDANAVKAIANNVQRNEIPSGKEVAKPSISCTLRPTQKPGRASSRCDVLYAHNMQHAAVPTGFALWVL